MYGQQVQMACGSGCGEVDYAQALARWAQMELLKEKVKARLDKKYGAKLEKVADLVVDLVAERAENAEGVEKKEAELREAFGELGEDEE